MFIPGYDQFCQQILQKNPQIIILISLIKQGKIRYTPSDLCLKALLSKQKVYQLTKTFFTGDVDSSYRYELFTIKKTT